MLSIISDTLSQLKRMPIDVCARRGDLLRRRRILRSTRRIPQLRQRARGNIKRTVRLPRHLLRKGKRLIEPGRHLRPFPRPCRRLHTGEHRTVRILLHRSKYRHPVPQRRLRRDLIRTHGQTCHRPHHDPRLLRRHIPPAPAEEECHADQKNKGRLEQPEKLLYHI